MAFDFRSGALTVGQYRGAPIRLHWSLLLLFGFLGRGSLGAWAALTVVLAIHELGHVVMVRAVGARITEFFVHGAGGHCEWSGRVPEKGQAAIAWGGVLFQLGLFSLAWSLGRSGGGLSPWMEALTWTNVQIAAVNLIPIRPLDGALGFRHLTRLWRGRSAPAAKPRSPPRAKDLPPEDDEAATHGRVTDRETSERLFRKVYDGIDPALRGDEKREDPEPD